ncbi:hypothetical protein B7R22_05385 [Subtercola boreus]|uniref:Phage portal protein n=1 Tax=Subtercola boreus TaxID=120213 RepID=A0A3E0W1G1_9MICO|nr:phage portal protein [Subtercola boreus]RFA15841.1 hypothetical protein B7R22_05385 [Subtercola boreus]
MSENTALDEALRLVDACYGRISFRRAAMSKQEEYFGGKQPLTFATAEWKRKNAQRYSGFSDNWCGAVVNAESERIRHTGVKIADSPEAAMVLHEQWLINEMDMQSSQGFVTTLTTGRSYVIVWGDTKTDEPLITWEHPMNVEIEYDWANPRLRVAALKTWVDDTKEYGTLYTADYVWKFERSRASSADKFFSQAEQARQKGLGGGAWTPRAVGNEVWPLPNPIGEVPVVEIQNRPTLLGDPVSEIQGVMPMQDAINLLWAYLFLAADYASMPARVVMNQAPPKIPVLDSTGKKIGEKPVQIDDLSEKRLLFLTGDAKVGQWDAARLDVFTDTIDVAVAHIGSQTRTPPTYLVAKSGMSNVNADGLKASEIGLNKKVLEFQTFTDPALREMYRLVALAKGDKELAKMCRLAHMDWMNPEIRSEAQLADALLKMKTMGFPLEYLMELYGLSPTEVERVLAMVDEQNTDPQLQAALRPAQGQPGGVLNASPVGN